MIPDTPEHFQHFPETKGPVIVGPMTQTVGGRRSRPGRPRHIPDTDPLLDPRAQLLDAAAELFVSQGYAKTSTREIAEAVGIRQASLYYHFSGKDAILAEVVGATIRPTLDRIGRIEAATTGEPAAALYLLVLLDVRTLSQAPHNSGLLGMLPDVAKEMPELREERAELAHEYGRLGAQIAPHAVYAPFGRWWGDQLLQHVEGVIAWIADGSFGPRSADALAGSCLRMCSADQGVIDAAAAAAHDLLPDVLAELDD